MSTMRNIIIYLVGLYAFSLFEFSQEEFSMGIESNSAKIEEYWQYGEFDNYIAGFTELISVNDSTQADLETLSGIGPATAEKIILYREENGDFSTVEDLLNVKGIGNVTLEKIKPYIVIE